MPHKESAQPESHFFPSTELTSHIPEEWCNNLLRKELIRNLNQVTFKANQLRSQNTELKQVWFWRSREMSKQAAERPAGLARMLSMKTSGTSDMLSWTNLSSAKLQSSLDHFIVFTAWMNGYIQPMEVSFANSALGAKLWTGCFPCYFLWRSPTYPF